jgi:hypothetical protein
MKIFLTLFVLFCSANVFSQDSNFDYDFNKLMSNYENQSSEENSPWVRVGTLPTRVFFYNKNTLRKIVNGSDVIIGFQSFVYIFGNDPLPENIKFMYENAEINCTQFQHRGIGFLRFYDSDSNFIDSVEVNNKYKNFQRIPINTIYDALHKLIC